MSNRVGSSDRRQHFFSMMRVGLASLACAISISSCGQSEPILNPDPLVPFIQASYSVEGAVVTFKQEFQPISSSDRLTEEDWNKYRKGRQLYNQASSSINAVVVQVMLANQTRTALPEVEFKQQLAQAIRQAVDFQEYAESTTRGESPSAKTFSQPSLSLAIPVTAVDVPGLLNSIFGQINTALGQVRNAEQDKRDKIEAILRSLLLPPFDEAGKKPQDSFSPPVISPK